MLENHINKTLKEYLNIVQDRLSCGEEAIYIGLFGSQNYNASDNFSDIDAMAIVIPNTDDIILGHKISKQIELENGAHIVIKDLASFVNELIKCSSYTFEVLETKYHYPENPHPSIQELMNMKNRIFQHNLESLYRTLWSMGNNHYRRCRNEDILLDSKKISNIIRSNWLWEDVLNGKTFGDAVHLDETRAKKLMYIKRLETQVNQIGDLPGMREELEQIKEKEKEKNEQLYRATFDKNYEVDRDCIDAIKRIYIDTYKNQIRKECK